MSSSPLWTPSAARVERSNLRAFQRAVEAQSGRRFASYTELWRWSVDEREAFWRAAWDYCEVIGEPGPAPWLVDDRMPGARFFPGARLNYAENLLCRDDAGPALVFRGEDGARAELSWAELRRQVASLAAEGEPLLDFLGEAKVAFDDMCDRSPVGEVEVVPVCHRVVQHSNWKFFMENQLDALHPSVTHQSTGIAAGRVERRLKEQQGSAPLYYHYLSAFASSFEQWDSVQTINYPQGHGILKAYMGLRPQDKDTLEHEALLKQAYGETKAEEYLSRSIHHVLVYPYLSVQSPLQQLRCLRPLAPDRTLSEIWHFRLKGAPEAIYRRSLWYYNLVNSPATMINADDLENWTKGQWGLQSDGGDWVSFHRHMGDDRIENGVAYSNHGTSEVVMRSQFAAWSRYMDGSAA